MYNNADFKYTKTIKEMNSYYISRVINARLCYNSVILSYSLVYIRKMKFWCFMAKTSEKNNTLMHKIINVHKSIYKKRKKSIQILMNRLQNISLCFKHSLLQRESTHKIKILQRAFTVFFQCRRQLII